MAKVTPIEFRPSKLVAHLEPADPTQEHKYSVFVRMTYNEIMQVQAASKAHGELIWTKNLCVQKEITSNIGFYQRKITQVFGFWKEFDEKLYTWILVTVTAPHFLYHISVITDGSKQKILIHNDVDTLWRSTDLILAVVSHTKQIYTDGETMFDNAHLYIMYVPDGLNSVEGKPVRLLPITWNTPWEVILEGDRHKHPLITQLPKVEETVVKASHPLLIAKFQYEEEKDDSQHRV